MMPTDEDRIREEAYEEGVASLKPIIQDQVELINNLDKQLQEAQAELALLKSIEIKKVQETDNYLIGLNEYQCRNIKWLCNVIGYPYGNGGVEPFTFANTGDWLGELHNLVEKGCDNSRPNLMVEELRKRIDYWLEAKLKDTDK